MPGLKKKDPMQFTIHFSEFIPRHREVAEFLNRCGRKKAYIIAEAVYQYIHGGGQSETEGVSFLLQSEEASDIQKVWIPDTADYERNVAQTDVLDKGMEYVDSMSAAEMDAVMEYMDQIEEEDIEEDES